MLAQVLHLLSILIKYGYYDDPEDVHKPLQHILIILDERLDLKLDKKPEVSKSRKKSNQYSNPPQIT